jgi:VWFA-related protein
MTTRPLLAIGAFALAAAAAAAAVTRAQQPVFRAGADAVIVDVSVTLKNRPVTGLVDKDFELTDNGVPQKILDVGRETTPIDLTLILDIFGPYRSALVKGVDTVRKGLRPEDRVSLVTFDRRVEERLGLGSADALGSFDMAGLARSDGSYAAPHVAALYDALTLALPLHQVAGRRQMAILLTSGPDAGSFAGERDALEVARCASTAIFVVGAEVDTHLVPVAPATTPAGERGVSTSSPQLMFSPPPVPRDFLRVLAEETGGVLQIITPAVYTAYSRWHVELRSSDAELDAKFVRALDDFRSSYSLRYTPQGVPRAGWHDLNVRVTKPGVVYQVRARKGYAG